MKGLIVTTDGFEDSEFSYPFYRLREEDGTSTSRRPTVSLSKASTATSSTPTGPSTPTSRTGGPRSTTSS
ncbi:hypothetical protein ACFQJD_14485 [Haloplanus sp. GCM10025708]|uniref:hypothetical protein n=1 Tax=Haloplanus sp. GCM10025708 TaxID=3252679 RepID=UPI003623D62A